MKIICPIPFLALAAAASLAEASVWINEFHYDNRGGDKNEFIEIAYTSDVDITTHSVVVYNGNGGAYRAVTPTPGMDQGGGIYLTTMAVSGLQNGPDGIALIGADHNVIEFISYEGTFTATDGAAMGMTSVDIGVSESGTTGSTESLQRAGHGCAPSDFTWLSPQPSTKGSVNVGQTFSCQSSVQPVDPTMVSNASGSGTIHSVSVATESTKTIGYLPAGVADVYIAIDSTIDVDIQLFAGDIALVERSTSSSTRQHFSWNGVRVEYSGFRGEDTSTTLGKEFLFLSGTLQADLTLKVYGTEAGTATVTYNWGYYDTAYGNAGVNLKQALHNIIDEHTEITYTEAWDAIKRTDQYVGDSAYVMTLYSRRPTLKTDQDDGSNLEDDWNREHVWPKSHGDFGITKGPGTDIHALRASDRTVNTERSAKDFMEGGSSLSTLDARNDCPDCLETSFSFEPPDEVKGSVARMIFYMATRYNGDSGSNGLMLTAVDITNTGTSFGYSTQGNGELGDLATLLAWNDLYPPTDEEYYRNNLIFQIQGNRNPFIDHPEWANSVF